MSVDEFHLFRDFVHRHTGIALGDTKKLMLASRLSRRLRHHGLSTFREYYDLVSRRDLDGGELRELINCVTTNKTSFFREPAHFDFLRQSFLPAFRDRASQGGPRSLRIWSAPCSTGEEAYSIVMTVCDVLSPIEDWDFKILASDLDTNVLAHGDRGIYTQESIADLPITTKRSYFLKGNNSASGMAMVKPFLRRLVDFERINLIEANWPVRNLFDVIFCRNLLIYFDRATQEKVIRRLLKQLKPEGYLIVGHSEHLYWMSDVVERVSGTVYRVLTSPRKGA